MGRVWCGCVGHICLAMVGVEEWGFFERTVFRSLGCHSDVMRASCKIVRSIACVDVYLASFSQDVRKQV